MADNTMNAVPELRYLMNEFVNGDRGLQNTEAWQSLMRDIATIVGMAQLNDESLPPTSLLGVAGAAFLSGFIEGQAHKDYQDGEHGQ